MFAVQLVPTFLTPEVLHTLTCGEIRDDACNARGHAWQGHKWDGGVDRDGADEIDG